MLISVVIATINRREELRDTILAYQSQTHPDVEIVIIDNGSTDGTREMMQADFPQVEYLWLPYNMGTHAINIGFERARGEVLWLSNNDSYPEGNDAFARLADFLTEHQHVDIVGSEDIEVRDGNKIYHWHPIDVNIEDMPPDGFKTNLFHGTGAAVRRRVYEDIGGFWDVFLFEEMDYCARAIARGYSIRYLPTIRTLHFASVNQRVNYERWIMSALNMSRFTWRYFPFWQAVYRMSLYFPYFFMQGLFYPARPIQMLDVMFGMVHQSIRAYRRERSPLTRDQLQQVTLGLSPLKMMWRYISKVLQRRLNRRRKNRKGD